MEYWNDVKNCLPPYGKRVFVYANGTILFGRRIDTTPFINKTHPKFGLPIFKPDCNCEWCGIIDDVSHWKAIDMEKPLI